MQKEQKNILFRNAYMYSNLLSKTNTKFKLMVICVRAKVEMRTKDLKGIDGILLLKLGIH